MIHWFGHGQQASLSVTDVEALHEDALEPIRNLSYRRNIRQVFLTDLDVQLKRHRSDVGVEIECSCCATAQPVAHIFGIGQGRTEGYDADGTLNLRRDVPHPGADDLQHRLNRFKIH